MSNIPSERALAAANGVLDLIGTSPISQSAIVAEIDKHFPGYDKLQVVYDAAVAWEKQYEKSKLFAHQGSIDEGIAESKKLKDARDKFWAAVRAVGGEND